MKFSFVMPAYNEQDIIETTVIELYEHLKKIGASDYEINVINDHSTDQTADKLKKLKESIPTLNVINNELNNGFGNAIKFGISKSSGEFVIIIMGDRSDDVNDVEKYLYHADNGYDCVFGSRFLKDSHIYHYPMTKLILNRAGNYLIKFLFGFEFNDITNAFKLYRKSLLLNSEPIVSETFNITVELALKALSQNPKVIQIPINWIGREKGFSKFSFPQVAVKYLKIIAHYYIKIKRSI